MRMYVRYDTDKYKIYFRSKVIKISDREFC